MYVSNEVAAVVAQDVALLHPPLLRVLLLLGVLSLSFIIIVIIIIIILA